MIRWKYLIPVIIGIVITGCVPKRFEWSPDGKWMTIMSNDGLHVCDANGTLLPGSVPGVGIATWFPDSKRILVAKGTQVSSWAELKALLPAGQVQTIVDATARVRAAALSYDWSKGSWGDFGKSAGLQLDETLQGPVAVCLLSQVDDEWKQKVPGNSELDKASVEIVTLEICNVDASGLTEGTKLYSTLEGDGVVELRMSPTGKAAIMVVLQHDQGDKKVDACDLTLVSMDGSKPPIPLPDNSSWYPDWSPDGNSVVFATASQVLTHDASLGTLRRERVIGDDGNVLDQPKDQEDLAGMVFSPFSRVRWLADGRIVFASAQVTLPTTPDDLPQRMELFAVMPGKQATVSRLFPQHTVDQIGDAAEYFEVSPDGQFASIPGSSGRVDVVELATGNVSALQQDDFPNEQNHDGPQLPSVPSWRTGDELTFAAPDGPGRMKVMIEPIPINRPGTRSISDGWPKELLETGSQASTQPATQP